MKKKSGFLFFTFFLIGCLTFWIIGQNKDGLNNQQVTKPGFSESIGQKVVLTEKAKKKSKKKESKKKKSQTNEAIDIQTGKTSVPVTVYNSADRIVKTLKQTDFTVFENGVEQEITYFKKSDEGITIVLVMDASNSGQMKFDAVKNSFIEFIDKIRPKDKIEVVVFDEKIKLIADSNTERKEIKKRIQGIKPGGGTSLYDSIDDLLSSRLIDIQEPKAFILLTDGVDTSSQKNSFNEILQKVDNSNAVFSVIYNNTFNDFVNVKPKIIGNSNLNAILSDILRNGGVVVGGRPGASSGMTKEEYEVGINFLNNLVSLSGGRAVNTNSTPDEFLRAFEFIYDELTNQYLIGYESKNDKPASSPREIKVRINQPDLFIRTRGALVIEGKQ